MLNNDNSCTTQYKSLFCRILQKIVYYAVQKDCREIFPVETKGKTIHTPIFVFHSTSKLERERVRAERDTPENHTVCAHSYIAIFSIVSLGV
jgi:hypothetical protein